MTDFAINHFSAVECIHELRRVKFTEEQAEVVIKMIEYQQQLIQEQKLEIDAIKTKEPATKKDLEVVKLELQKEIITLRHDTLRFVVWTGCGVSAVIISSVYAMLKAIIH